MECDFFFFFLRSSMGCDLMVEVFELFHLVSDSSNSPGGIYGIKCLIRGVI